MSTSTLPTSRSCTVCKNEKPLGEFGKQSNGKYGRKSACRTCARRLLAEYRKTPKGRAKYREYAERHREKPGYAENHRKYRYSPKAQWMLYKSGAVRRGLEFEFTLEEFIEFFWQKPCSYCGDPIPSVGVDRIDNSAGYTKANATPCCSTCNFMKLKCSAAEFIAKCVRVARHSGFCR